jgi:Flp pilus assembly protein TadG
MFWRSDENNATRCRAAHLRLPPRHAQISGQAIVEFAIVSLLFFLTVFGMIDFGRAIFLKSELDNAVREAARELKTRTASGLAANNCGSITQAEAQYVVRMIKNPEEGGACKQGEHPRPGLETATATISCTPSCTVGSKLTVTGYLSFQAITQDLLGISPITLSSSSTVTLE